MTQNVVCNGMEYNIVVPGWVIEGKQVEVRLPFEGGDAEGDMWEQGHCVATATRDRQADKQTDKKQQVQLLTSSTHCVILHCRLSFYVQLDSPTDL